MFKTIYTLIIFIIWTSILFGLFKICSKKIKDKSYNLLIFIEMYLLITVVLFYFGPIDYPYVNTGKTLLLLFLYNLFFVVGYIISNNKIRLFKKGKNEEISTTKLNRIITVFSLISIFLSFGYFIEYIGTINPLNIIDTILMGINQPDVAYLYNLNLEKSGGFITKVTTILSPITYSLIPMGIYYLKKLKIMPKILLTISIIMEMGVFLSKGTNFGLFKIIVVFITIYIIQDKKIKIGFVKSLSIVFVITYFLFAISSRMNYTSVPSYIFGISVDSENFIFKLLPIGLSIPIMLAISYVSQGYYGLSLAFLYEFKPTFGFGNGRFLMEKAEQVFNVDLWDRTYQAQMSPIWNDRVNWHTAYLWFANDVSLYGVIMIMFILGVVFCAVLKDAKYNKNLIAIILLPLYMLMIIFLPANNIVFDNPLIFIPFIVFNIIWLLSNHIRIKKY